MIKEIIRDNFKKAKEHVYNLLMPTFFGIDESHPPRPLCDVSFANRQTQNIDFNSILNQCIIDTLEEASLSEYVVNDFTPLIFEPEKDYKDIKSIADLKAQKSLNLEYIKSSIPCLSALIVFILTLYVIKTHNISVASINIDAIPIIFGLTIAIVVSYRICRERYFKAETLEKIK